MLLGRHPRFHRLAHHPVEAEQKEIVGVAIIGAYGRTLVRGTELGDGADRLRQAVPGRGRRAAAQEYPDAGIEQIVGNVAIDRLMGVGNAACGIGGNEFPAVNMTRQPDGRA